MTEFRKMLACAYWLGLLIGAVAGSLVTWSVMR